jgi:hypothetical protein
VAIFSPHAVLCMYLYVCMSAAPQSCDDVVCGEGETCVLGGLCIRGDCRRRPVCLPSTTGSFHFVSLIYMTILSPSLTVS